MKRSTGNSELFKLGKNHYIRIPLDILSVRLNHYKGFISVHTRANDRDPCWRIYYTLANGTEMSHQIEEERYNELEMWIEKIFGEEYEKRQRYKAKNV